MSDKFWPNWGSEKISASPDSKANRKTRVIREIRAKN